MEHRRFSLLLTSLVALMAIQMQVEAQQLPRLVVCISVDQLRTDYLRAVEPMMGEGGLKHILHRGRVWEEVDFPLYQPNTASTTASIFTGAYPSVHGIESSEVYLAREGKHAPIFEDKSYLGNYTRDSFSPRALLVRTLGDRLKEASQGQALVYSIAPTAEQALVGAGELGDGAYWLDERIGSWATSNYYPQMLQAVEHYNRSEQGPNKRLIAGMQWKPLRSYSRPSLSYSDWSKGFSHRYNASSAGAYRESGIVNEEVTNLALRVLEGAGYAERKSPSLLSLAYTAKAHGIGELTAEDLDSYLRLDAELARLFKAIDKHVGLQNCLVALSGTGYTNYNVYRDGKSDRLKRSLNVARITALANMYLTALYGQGAWISDNHNGRLYLNRRLIETKGLDLERVQRTTAEVLSSAEGVALSVAAHELRSSSDERLKRIARSIHARYAADVYWSVLPDWQVEDSKDNRLLMPTSGSVPSPFVLMGKSIEPSQETLPQLDVRDIVRIICTHLSIRPPND